MIKYLVIKLLVACLKRLSSDYEECMMRKELMFRFRGLKLTTDYGYCYSFAVNLDRPKTVKLVNDLCKRIYYEYS